MKSTMQVGELRRQQGIFTRKGSCGNEYSTQSRSRPCFSAAIAAFCCSLCLAGCGGGNAALPPQSIGHTPTISSLSPASATAGGPQFTLTVSGSNFIAGAVVMWNGNGRATTFLSSTQLSATILASDIAAAGNANVNMVNSAPGSLSSNAMPFAINAATAVAPTISSLSPSGTTVGGPEFTLTVNGANFASGAVVTWNGNHRVTTFVSSTQLFARILASDIVTTGIANVRVVNPAPGSLSSNAAAFAIFNWIAVAVWPQADTLGRGGVRAFEANMAVTWTVREGAAGGSITSAGVYTAPQSTGTFHVVATSAADNTNSLAATITVVQSGFTPGGYMTTGRGGSSATLLQEPDVRVLIAGGDSEGTAELFDPANGSFTATGKMTAVRAGATATLLQNGTVLIIGGIEPTTGLSLASAEIYNPVTGSFVPAGKMANSRVGHTATLLPDGRVLVTGGYDCAAYPCVPQILAAAELFDPVTGVFTPTGSMAVGRIEHTATLLPNGRVLVAGGNNNGTLATTELFDPLNGTFTAAANMTGPRELHSATLLANGKVLLVGGYGEGMLDTAEMFDPINGTFTAAGSMSTARESHTATLLPNGTVLIAGGDFCTVDDCGPIFYSAEVFDTATGSSVITGSMADSRTGHSATLLRNGTVLVIGGEYGPFYKLAELYR
jgi:hypothetical protein